jgi:hypothetical protein
LGDEAKRTLIPHSLLDFNVALSRESPQDQQLVVSLLKIMLPRWERQLSGGESGPTEGSG